MKNFNEIPPQVVDLGETDRMNLARDIYRGLFKNLDGVFYAGAGAKEQSILDCNCTRSCVRENLPPGLNAKYYGLDEVEHYDQGGRRYRTEIVGDINKIPATDHSFDVIFVIGNRFGYGKYHDSLKEIERIIRPGGTLICGLSRYIFNRGINQLLLVYRDWHYHTPIEVRYTLADEKPRPVETSQFFTIYSYRGA